MASFGTRVDIAQHDDLYRWLIEDKGMPQQNAEPTVVEAQGDFPSSSIGLTAVQDLQQGQVVLDIPGDMAVSLQDVQQHPQLGEVVGDVEELVALALWLMAERASGDASPWSALIRSMPETTLSPLVWPEATAASLLKGSGVLPEVLARRQALSAAWQRIAPRMTDDSIFPPDAFNEGAFLRAFCVVLATSVYLPAAQCFALVPMVSSLRHTGNGDGCDVDFNFDTNSVCVTAGRSFAKGEEVRLNDPRPNAEVLLSTGMLQASNTSNCLEFNASLVSADRLYMQKLEVATAFGYEPSEVFPLYEDRFPLQLLSYLRLSRLQDTGLLIRLSFESDVILSQANEYEVLQLMMADLRDRLTAFEGDMDDDVKLLQDRESLTAEEALAAKLRLTEKRILRSSMDAVRRRLAPIRGIPTKGGQMQDPNADLLEIFETIEDLPNKPKKMMDSFAAWWRGTDSGSSPR